MRRSRLLGASMLLSVQMCLGTPPSVAADNYEVEVQRNVRVPMRDGVHLATDLYIPVQHGKPLAERLPAVLLRTPYNKAAWGIDIARYFAEHGYLSATQDCRGRFESEGKFFPFVDDPTDGSDTIAWLARHRRCNGKVAMHGPSYMAWVQFHAATRNPPGLATMIPMHGPTNAYHYDPRNTVSSNGRCIIAYGPAAGSGFSGMGPRDQIELETLPGHGRPGKRIADRPDVLVYQTPPISEWIRRTTAHGSRRDLPAAVPPGAHGEPVPGWAPYPRGRLQQQLPQFRHQSQYGRAGEPASAGRHE